MGLTVADLQRLTGAVADKDSPGIYRAQRVPQPHAAFESYTFVVAPTTGLCKLWATGKTIDNDAYGTALHSEFDGLQEVLDQKYGPHKNYDELNEGSIWREPREWMERVWSASYRSELPGIRRRPQVHASRSWACIRPEPRRLRG